MGTERYTMQESYHDLVRRDVFPFVPRGGTLLDVGGGIGATAAALRRDGTAARAGVADLVAPDAAAAGLDFAYAGDLTDAALLERIAAEQGPIDTILALDVLEHLVDPWAMVARLHAILRPGGAIVASIPNVRHYSALLPLLFRNEWELADAGVLDRTHLRFFVRDTAVALMTSSGLTLDRVEPINGQRRMVRALDVATFNMFRSFTALQWMVRVTKPA